MGSLITPVIISCYICDRTMMRTVPWETGWTQNSCPIQTLCTVPPALSVSLLRWVDQWVWAVQISDFQTKLNISYSVDSCIVEKWSQFIQVQSGKWVEGDLEYYRTVFWEMILVIIAVRHLWSNKMALTYIKKFSATTLLQIQVKN